MNKSFVIFGTVLLFFSIACQNALNESTEISNCDEAIPSIINTKKSTKSLSKIKNEQATEYLEWTYDVLSEKLTLLHDNLCGPCGIGDSHGYSLDYELIFTDDGLELKEFLKDIDRFNNLKCSSCVYDMKLTATIPNEKTKFKVTKEIKDFENGTQNFLLFSGELDLGQVQGRLPLLATDTTCLYF